MLTFHQSPDFYKLNPEICKLEGKIKHMEKINRQLRMQVNTKNQLVIFLVQVTNSNVNI